MWRRARAGLMAGAAAGALAPAATAADIAMIVGAAETPADQATLLGDLLNARGYEVYDRQGASRDDLAEVLGEVAGRLTDAERLMLVYVGPAQGQGSRAWLLPEGYAGEDRISAAFAGAPLDLLLDMAGQVPGRSAVIVAADDEAAGEAEAQGFLDLAAGVGAPEPPQGVLLVAGPAEATLGLVIDGLLGEAGSVAAGLETLPEGVEAFGFRSPENAFATGLSDVAPPAEREAAAPPAPEPVPAPAPEPVEAVNVEEAAEEALNLSQATRRQIQEQLTLLGYSTRGIDGIFGPGTRAAVAEWQRDQALGGSGFVNAEQLALLTALADARSAELATAAERARQEEEAADAAFWRTTGQGGAAADLRAYLARYPDGIYAPEARAALDAEEAAAMAAAAAGDRDAWAAAEAEGRQRSYRAYLEAYPQGAFADQALARIDALRAEPEQARANEAAAAGEEALGLNQGSRALIEGQLAAIGYDVGAPDGAFDETTRRALREFQTRQGLEVTGYVNQQTVQALIVASLGLR